MRYGHRIKRIAHNRNSKLRQNCWRTVEWLLWFSEEDGTVFEPQNIEDYNKKEFWEDAFQKYKVNYDWYGKYDDFQTYFAQYIKKSDRILMVGCGNSTLGEKLLESQICIIVRYDHGYHNVLCVDYSESVIARWTKEREEERRWFIKSWMQLTWRLLMRSLMWLLIR